MFNLTRFLESAAGRSHARSSVGGGVGYKDSRAMGLVDRMEGGRKAKKKSPRKQPFIGRVKAPFRRAEEGRYVPLSAILEKAGIDFNIPMGTHGIGTSPSASGDPTDPTTRYRAHVRTGSAKLAKGGPWGPEGPFDHLPRGKKKRKRRRKR